MRIRVMGIVNVTPDSFSDGGDYLDPAAAVRHGLALRTAGADLLDVGGESTRPGAERVSPLIEQERVLPVIADLARSAPVSVDTMNADTAARAVAAGARIVNDVSGGLADPELLRAVADTTAEIVLGHWRGHSEDMYAAAEYASIIDEVRAELAARVEAAVAAGIASDRIIIDPGIGFAKRGAQNWAVLRGLARLVEEDGPRLLIGTSRKRFLADALSGEDGTAERDLATAVTSVLAQQAGAWGVRVHNVTATIDALRVAEWGGTE